ncbi:hypothetical protein N7444_001989 [Penicillium canescens]|nr:hypothetical protein N7444_001989 [Penicillium canescens]
MGSRWETPPAAAVLPRAPQLHCWTPVVVPLRCPKPGGLMSPALLESVDQWSLTIPETQIPGGSRPAESAVRRRCPRGLDPSPEGRMPQPASARKGV